MNQAVFTGINLYQHYPDESLRGCIQDANNLWMLASNRLVWNPQGLRVLKDNLATAGFEKELVLRMVKDAKPGEHLIWSHSSHGTNNPDPSQKDGLQELLCSYDLREKGGLWDTTTCISAKWIGDLLLHLHPQATLDVILDCCHAPEGSQLKELGLSYSRARFLRRSEVGVPVNPLVRQLSKGMPPNVALWSACEPQQTSADAYIDKAWQGAFTAAFLKAFQPDRARTDIIYYARKWLRENRYAQVPHLYAGQEMAQGKIG